MEGKEREMAGEQPPSRREGLLVALLGAISDAPVCVLDRELRLVEYLWGREERSYGFTPSEILGKRFSDLVSAEDAAPVEQAVREVFESGEPRRLTSDFGLPVGRIAFDVRLDPIRGPTGEVENVLSTSYDVTERQRAQEALRESERLFASLAEAAPVGIVRIDARGDLVYANRVTQEIVGLPWERMKGTGWIDAVLPDDREKVAALRLEDLAATGGRDVEVSFLHPDGSIVCALTRSIVAPSAGGAHGGFLAILLDITERKRFEEALRESEHRYATLAETLPLGVWRTDAATRMVYANHRLWEILDLVPESLVDLDLGAVTARVASERRVDPSEVVRLWPLAEMAVREKTGAEFEMRWRTADGRTRWLYVRAVPELDSAGTFIGHVGALADITERKQTEEALRASEHRFQSLAEAMPIGVWRTDIERRLLYANRRNWELLDADPEDPENRSLHELLARMAACGRIDAEDSERLWDESERAVHDERVIPSRFRLRLDDGSERELQTLAVPEFDAEDNFVGNVGVTIDVTELTRAQRELARHRDHLGELVAERTVELERSYEALRRSERLAAVGTFAAGIAHQINNPVGAILLAGQFALEEPGNRQRVEMALRDITADARHCGRIVRGVLEFAQGPTEDPRPCDLNRIVRACSPKLEADGAEHGASLRLALDPELPPAAGSASALEQVLANLVANAIEAAAREIVIATRQVEDGVELMVRDDGSGIAYENLDRIFDPLFTTRSSLGGTGLGLALARGVVEAHGGSIEVKSRESEGTAVTVRLRRA
jgi:PAS domain S-box-containing protein